MRLKKGHVVKRIKKTVPIIEWLPKYNGEKAVGDLIAGITVGLTLIPQSIAYAALAGLEPQYGLYSSLCGGFIYACFGTVKDLNIAPTALISLLTYSYTKKLESPEAAIFLCFAVGVLQMLFGLFKLGFLVDFVSTPVVSGFTSAGAMTIAASQVKSMLGLKFRAESFLEVVYHVIENIKNTKWPDAILSLICCCVLISFRELKRWGTSPSAENSTKSKTAIWFLSVGRNALIVISTSVFSYFLHHNNLFTLTNDVPDGLPQISLPFKIDDVYDKTMGLGSGIVIVALVAILSNMAIAKAFSNGKVLNASHEMSTLGLCNIVGSFFGSFPVNASFSRAALNNASGARTTFGGIYTGVMAILSLTFLTKYFVFIPKASLASVIFCAVIYMVEFDMFKTLWKTSKIDLIPLLATFLWSLIDTIERGILVGVLVDLLLVIWWTSRPKMNEETIAKDSISYVKLPLVANLSYASGEYLRESIRKVVTDKCGDEHRSTVASKANHVDKTIGDKGKICFIVLDCDKLQRIDYTATKAFGSLLCDLTESTSKSTIDSKIVVVFTDLKEDLRIKIQNIIKKDINCTDTENLDEFLEQISNDASTIKDNTNDANTNGNGLVVTTSC